MREIKFRAWDGNKMWPYAVPILACAYNGGTINVSASPEGSGNKFINGILIQFTGLHDKNGQEIYEGDIIANYAMIDVVIFDKGAFVGKNSALDKFGCHQKIYVYDSIVVIGNIYENPELL